MAGASGGKRPGSDSRLRERKAPRRRLSPEQRRRQILDAAIAYFAEVGFDGGTRALADKLGVTQPLIYRYFSSKENLIREVYNEVYLGRWRPEWEDLLRDRSKPLRERLITFYKHYTEMIFDPDWLRIYMFSGLRGVGINQWWITFVEERILRRICEEMRVSFDLPRLEDIPIQVAEIDLYWMFHGGIFYYGLRRNLYHLGPHLELDRFIVLSIDSLLEGMPGAIDRVLRGSETG